MGAREQNSLSVARAATINKGNILGISKVTEPGHTEGPTKLGIPK